MKRLEALAAFLLTCAVMVSIPLSLDGIGLSWDTMNHHVYLGWVASGARFDRDYFAASSQSYQFPYLYWPIYQLMHLQVAGWVAGVIWALLNATVSLPLWMIASRLFPEATLQDSITRLLAVLFGVGNVLVLRAPETTGNDVLAALPWLLAVAIGLGSSAERSEDVGDAQRVGWRAWVCGLLGGVAVALKLSNATVAILLPLLCMGLGGGTAIRMLNALCCLVGLGLGFAVLYAWWGWHLWEAFGNPVFPFADGAFEYIRAIVGWRSPIQ